MKVSCAASRANQQVRENWLHSTLAYSLQFGHCLFISSELFVCIFLTLSSGLSLSMISSGRSMLGLPRYQSSLLSYCASFSSRAATFTYWSSSKWQNQLKQENKHFRQNLKKHFKHSNEIFKHNPRANSGVTNGFQCLRCCLVRRGQRPALCAPNSWGIFSNHARQNQLSSELTVSGLTFAIQTLSMQDLHINMNESSIALCIHLRQVHQIGNLGQFFHFKIIKRVRLEISVSPGKRDPPHKSNSDPFY